MIISLTTVKGKKVLQFIAVLALSIVLIFCWNLELRNCFWTLNVVQIIYILVSFTANKTLQNFALNKKRIFGTISGELLLIIVLFFIASFIKSSEALIVILFISLMTVWLILIWNIFKLGQNLFDFSIINLYGLLSTLAVLRSNLYMLSPTYYIAMQQIIWSCMITYLVHLIFLALGCLKK